VKTETREIYRCDHCKKVYLSKYWCEQHEPCCKKNPDNYQPCMDGCPYIEKKEFMYCYDTFQGEGEYKVNVLYCTKKKEAVCPFWHNPYEIIFDKDNSEVRNELMPKECQYYKGYIEPKF
jgi:hypothetical protein